MRRVEAFDREEFLAERWNYAGGEHVSIIGPTDWGKTYLAHQLLEHSATPQLPAIEMVMKPRDSTVSRWGKSAGFRTVRTWPPSPVVWDSRKPPGWILWPKHTMTDLDRDNATMWKNFRAAMMDSYRKGSRIIFADEVLGLTTLGLDRELDAIWTRGRSMGCGLWGATQRPAKVPLNMYSQARHLFIGNDPDKRSRDRFAEIGGVDPELVKQTAMNLAQHEWLYIRRTGRVMCIVRA